MLFEPTKAYRPMAQNVYPTSMRRHYLYCERNAPLLFTENETNNGRIFGTPNIVGTGTSTQQVALYDTGLAGKTFGGNPGLSYSLRLPAATSVL